MNVGRWTREMERPNSEEEGGWSGGLTNLELIAVDFAILVAVKDLKHIGNLRTSASKRQAGAWCVSAHLREGPWKKVVWCASTSVGQREESGVA
jgi:hypothetical protein